jgi:hypothetical protein
VAEHLGPGPQSALIEHTRTIPDDGPAVIRLAPATSQRQNADDHGLAYRHHGVHEERLQFGDGPAYRQRRIARTTTLYDRREEEISLDEVERIAI